MSDNPFSAPEGDARPGAPRGAAPHLAIPRQLDRMGGNHRIVGWILTTSGVFLVLAALAAVYVGFSSRSGGGALLVALVYSVLAVVYLALGGHLRGSGASIARARVDDPDIHYITALRHQADFWNLMAMLAMVMLACYALVFLVLCVGAIT